MNVFIVLPAEISPMPPSHTDLLLQMSQDPEIQAESAADAATSVFFSEKKLNHHLRRMEAHEVEL